MNVLKFFFVFVGTVLLLTNASAVCPQGHLPKQICDDYGIRPCDVKSVDAYSEADLDGDGMKEIIFAYDGGSCGEQHYVYAQKSEKWVQLANWCGMDGGAYQVLSSKHKGYFDIDTYIGVIRFDGKKYPDTTKK